MEREREPIWSRDVTPDARASACVCLCVCVCARALLRIQNGTLIIPCTNCRLLLTVIKQQQKQQWTPWPPRPACSSPASAATSTAATCCHRCSVSLLQTPPCPSRELLRGEVRRESPTLTCRTSSTQTDCTCSAATGNPPVSQGQWNGN